MCISACVRLRSEESPEGWGQGNTGEMNELFDAIMWSGAAMTWVGGLGKRYSFGVHRASSRSNDSDGIGVTGWFLIFPIISGVDQSKSPGDDTLIRL